MEENINSNNKKKQLDTVTTAYIALGVAITLLMTLLAVSAFLDIKKIVVDGMVIYTAQEVAQASGKSGGDNLLFINKRNIENEILTNLPYVRSVEVSRDMPDTLHIIIEESTPIAYMPFSGNVLVIDSTGRVLDILQSNIGTSVKVADHTLTEIRGIPINDATPGKLPVLGAGMESNFKAMQELLSAMEIEGIRSDVNYLDVSSITNISFGYMDMYRVKIGGLSNYRQKISSLYSTISQIRADNPNARGVLNMTDPSGYTTFAPD